MTAPVPLSQQVWDAQHQTTLEQALRSDPELVRVAKRYGWFTETIRAIEKEARRG